MAQLEVKTNDYIFQVNFNTKDAFMSTTLGCHAGTIGGFSLTINHVEPGRGFVHLGSPTVQYARKNGVYRKIMDLLVAGAKDAWGGWTSSGTSYTNKSHWILSAPWSLAEDRMPGEYAQLGTAEVMDLIAQFCHHEPEKYGRCVITVSTDCVAHVNNYTGGPATRTMIWHPPHVRCAENRTKTMVSGFYDPLPPKKGDLQRPVAIKKVKEVKKLPPRPARKSYVEAKRAPKYGPPKNGVYYHQFKRKAA